MKRLIALLAVLLPASCSRTSTTARLNLPPLKTVEHVDLQRYLGVWYEIASFPQKFQRGCTATTATYSPRSDGELEVVNRCRLETPEGREKSVKGRARVTDPVTHAKLEVTFFWPFWGDYWIIDLGPDYDYAVVGHPSRDYLWILSRRPVMDAALYDGIASRLVAQGYETQRLQRTVQPQ